MHILAPNLHLISYIRKLDCEKSCSLSKLRANYWLHISFLQESVLVSTWHSKMMRIVEVLLE